MQHIAFGRDDDRRRRAGKVCRLQWRGPPILGVLGAAQIVIPEPQHRLARQDAVAGREFAVARHRHRVVGDRINERLQAQSRLIGAARHQRDNGGEVGAGAVAMDAEPGGVRAEAAGIGVHPLQCREAVIDRGGEFVLGPHAVIDRSDKRPGAGAQIARDEIMRIEASDHVATAVVIDDRRHRIARIGLLRPVEAQPDRACGARDHALLDARDRQRLGLPGARRLFHLCPRLRGSQGLDRPQPCCGLRLQHRLNLWVQFRHAVHLLMGLLPRIAKSDSGRRNCRRLRWFFT